jgi:hypothetical protein
MKSLLLGSALLVMFVFAAGAQPYSINWFKVAGGGGTSTGGSYSLSGTVGQQDAGKMTGGQYGLVGGYWSVISVVPTTDSPQLNIRLTTTNTAVVYWQSPSSGFILQQKTNVTDLNWITAPQVVTDDGTNRSIVVNPPAGRLFYRLKK